MKNNINALLAILTIVIFTTTSCVDKKYDKPKFEIPTVDTTGVTVITIEELLSLYLPSTQGTVSEKIDTNIYVRGVVTANDESGNLYKQIFIQDETRGINIQIDKTSLFTIFPVGQVVYLRCKNFYVGNYSGIPQFGYKYNGGPGRIPTHLVDSAIFTHELPDLNNVPEPKTVSSVAAGTFTANDVNKLVKITNVSFVKEAGKLIFANKNEVYPERTVKDAAGNLMVLSTSWYANFAADSIPSGSGDITGVLSIFSGANRLIIRSIDDVKMYKSIFSAPFDTDPTNWTKTNISGTGVWGYNSTDKCMKISGWVSGATTPNDDWLISPEFNLTSAINPIFSFSSRRRFADTETEPIAVYVTTDNTATASTPEKWVKLSATFDTNTTSTFGAWVLSGDVNLSSYVGTNVRIAFRYKSTANGSGTASYWDIDNVNINDK